MSERKLGRCAHLCVGALTGGIVLLVFIKYALAPAIPVVLSVMIASALRPVAKKLSRGSGRPERVYGTILALVVVFAVFYGVFLLGGKLIRELTAFLSSSLAGLEGENNIIRQTFDFVESIGNRFPMLQRLLSGDSELLSGEVYSTLTDGLKSLVTSAGARVTAFAAGVITALPGIAFACAVSVISVFYLTVDYGGVKAGLERLMPKSIYEKLKAAITRSSGALTGCLKAYLVLMLLTFAELFFGFVVLRVKYAFLLAALTAVVDLLPVFGVGTVLVPWSLFLFIKGETKTAVGMLVMLAVMYAVRQYAEPRLVGRFTGIHPMITLVSAYFGYTFFGITGMLASPIVLYVLKNAFSQNDSVEIGINTEIK